MRHHKTQLYIVNAYSETQPEASFTHTHTLTTALCLCLASEAFGWFYALV